MQSRYALLSALTLLFGGTQHAMALQVPASTLALEFTGATTGPSPQDATAGWSFTTNQTISVVALDAFAVAGGASQVRLYDSSGNTLAFANVQNTDPVVGSPYSFFSHAITPVTLAAGQTYYVAEDLPNGAIVNVGASGITTDPAVTYGGGVASGALGQNPLFDASGGAFGQGFFGPNFNFVPEPSTFVLAALGILGLGFIARRRK